MHRGSSPSANFSAARSVRTLGAPTFKATPTIDSSHGVGLNAVVFSYATRDVACLNRFASSKRRMCLVDERGDQGEKV